MFIVMKQSCEVIHQVNNKIIFSAMWVISEIKIFILPSLLNTIIESVSQWVGGRWVGGLVVGGWWVGG